MDLEFSETVKLLSELFGPNTSLFHKRWKCLDIFKDDQQDCLRFAAKVNKHHNDFKLACLTADDFKCLIFAQGLVSAEDAEIRRRVLTKLENEQGLTLKKLAEDCQRVVSVKRDSKTIEESGVAHIKKIKSKSTRYSLQKEKSKIARPKTYDKVRIDEKYPPPGPCYICADLHWMRFFPAKKKLTCKNCGKVGHKVTGCWYAKKPRKPRNKIRQTQSGDNKDRNLRKYVTVKIFNKTVKFLLDSSSDLSIINLHTWRRLNMSALLRTKKTARSVRGDSINILVEVVLVVTLNGITKKLIAYMLKNTDNLFGTNWIEKFNLWDCPMSTFCRKLENPIILSLITFFCLRLC